MKQCPSSWGLNLKITSIVLFTQRQFNWGPLLNFGLIVTCSKGWQEFAREMDSRTNCCTFTWGTFCKVLQTCYILAREPCEIALVWKGLLNLAVIGLFMLKKEEYSWLLSNKSAPQVIWWGSFCCWGIRERLWQER